MARNPNQIFIVSSFSRKQIAAEARNILEYGDYKHPFTQEVADDDDRLTDEICQQYVDAISDIDEAEWSEEAVLEAQDLAAVVVLESMGYVYQDEKEDQEAARIAILKEISETERLLAEQRARLAQLD